jgi:hypothetical protein
MRYCFLLILISIFLGSCEKAIDIKTGIKEEVLVVDGQIENGEAPLIYLSKSLNYFNTISLAVLTASFVRNAKVIISNGSRAHQLKEYAIPVAGGFSIYYYSTDTLNPSTAIIGEFGKTYTLTIEALNKQYTSVTTIPVLAKTVDSLWWLPAPRIEDTPRVKLMARVIDPQGYGNYIRYFTRVNSGTFLPGATSVYDDQIVDGKTYDIQVEQGIDRNNPPEDEDYGFFKRGDTATLKLANIDKVSYDFWRTLEFSYQSIGNPFSSPIRVLGNINNGALGAFCGYAVQTRTIIIPK